MRILLFILPLILVACQRPMPERSIWQGTMTLADHKQLPLRMHLDLSTSPASGSFIVGNELTPIPEIRYAGDSLVIELAEYQAAMKGTWNGTRWSGEFQRFRADTVRLPFVAFPEDPSKPPPVAPASTPAIRLAGTFRVYYHEPDGIDSSTVAKFWTKGDSVFGTFIDPSGDHGFMAGVQRGDSAWVGRYIGWQANLLELYYEEETWKGRYYARQYPPDMFTLVPRPSALREAVDPKRTRMKNPRAPFAFEGITIDGDTVRHTDAAFRGKALIVDIMGTWCHNCLDAAPVLQKISEEFGPQGLTVIGLAFEVTANPAAGRKNLAIYRQRHGITFPLLYAGSLDQAVVDAKLHAQLHDFFAYPTTLFIGRDGRVRTIHWGFKGPGTGEEYQHEVQAFYKHAREIVQ